MIQGTIYDDVHLVRVVEGAVKFRELINTLTYCGFLTCLAEDRLPSCKNGCAPYCWFIHSMERESAEDVFLRVIKGSVAGSPTHQLICYRSVYK